MSLLVNNGLCLNGEPSGTQNMRSGDLRLMSPSGNFDRVPEEFRWEALPQAKSYTVQLLEVDGTVALERTVGGKRPDRKS